MEANIRRICYPAFVACCYVEMIGEDGRTHSTTLDATSLYDAADQALTKWSRLWWFNSQIDVTVHRGGDCWRVSQEKLSAWRATRKPNSASG
jgi:hypothetical protein